MINDLTYDDVVLLPRYSTIKSRTQISLESDIFNYGTLAVPIFAAPMDTITGADMANRMHEYGGQAVLHRYNTIEEQVAEFKECHSSPFCAIGATGDFIERSAALYEAGCRNFCIDVAHGHHKNVKDAIKNLREIYEDIHIMAGNIATYDGYEDLARWGADSLRVGVGGGAFCTTRIVTGHGVPNIRALQECSSCKQKLIKEHIEGTYHGNLPTIIADGGIRSSGDAVKAIAFGAEAVMLGTYLAGTSDSIGAIEAEWAGSKTIKARGMASKEAQDEWRGWTRLAEGVSTELEHKGETSQKLEEFIMGMKSGFSYSGARNMYDFVRNVVCRTQTMAGIQEGRPHVLK